MKDPFSTPYPYYYHETTIDRLPSILKYGLLSKSEAGKKNIQGYKQNFNSSWNNDYISLVSNKTARQVAAPEIAILIDPSDILTIKAAFRNGDTNRPVESEVLVKAKILPEKFVGLVIGEVGYSYELEKPVKPHPLILEDIFKVVESKNITLTLPIYFKGKQLYP